MSNSTVRFALRLWLWLLSWALGWAVSPGVSWNEASWAGAGAGAGLLCWYDPAGVFVRACVMSVYGVCGEGVVG